MLEIKHKRKNNRITLMVILLIFTSMLFFVNIVSAKEEGSSYENGTWITYNTPKVSFRSPYEDSSGNIWFGTWRGAYKFNGSNLSHYVLGWERNGVICIHEDSLGNMWFGTIDGAYKINGTNIESYNTSDNLGDSSVVSIYENSPGNLTFIATASIYHSGIYSFDGTNWIKHNIQRDSQHRRTEEYIEPITIYIDNSKIIWFVGIKSLNLYLLNVTTLKPEKKYSGVAGGIVTALYHDSMGNLWIGTNNGVSKFDGNNLITYRKNDGLVDNLVNFVYEDSIGNFWFATKYGVSKFDGTKFTNYQKDDGLVDDNVYSIFEDPDGNLWFGTEKGLSNFDGNTWKTYLEGNRINSIYKDSVGNLWFGTNKGVSKYIPSDIQKPIIDSIGLLPTEVYAGDLIKITVIAKDNIGVTDVTANGLDLTHVGNTWNGNIVAASTTGIHPVTVVARDAAGNTVEASKSYTTLNSIDTENITRSPTATSTLTSTSTPKQPAFEAIFAIIGLLIVACFIRKKKKTVKT